MDGQFKKKGTNLLRMLREQIIHEYLSGRKTSAMLGREYGICPKTISKMITRYKEKNISNFSDIIFQPIMPRNTRVKTADQSALQVENEQLKQNLQLAQLKIESYQIMGDILEEEYGIDLLKKVEAGQSPVLKKETQK